MFFGLVFPLLVFLICTALGLWMFWRFLRDLGRVRPAQSLVVLFGGLAGLAGLCVISQVAANIWPTYEGWTYDRPVLFLYRIPIIGRSIMGRWGHNVISPVFDVLWLALVASIVALVINRPKVGHPMVPTVLLEAMSGTPEPPRAAPMPGSPEPSRPAPTPGDPPWLAAKMRQEDETREKAARATASLPVAVRPPPSHALGSVPGREAELPGTKRKAWSSGPVPGKDRCQGRADRGFGMGYEACTKRATHDVHGSEDVDQVCDWHAGTYRREHGVRVVPRPKD